jgi:hypothetical protein
MLENENRPDRLGNACSDSLAGRNPDGSIDYGHYRRQASILRRAKLRAALRHAAGYVPPLIAIAVATVAMFAVPAGGHQLPPEDAGVVNSWMDHISKRTVGLSTHPFKASDQRKI